MAGFLFSFTILSILAIFAYRKGKKWNDAVNERVSRLAEQFPLHPEFAKGVFSRKIFSGLRDFIKAEKLS